MFFRVNAGFEPEERANVIAVHVIDSDYTSETLQVDRNRSTRVPKIVAIVRDTDAQIEIPSEQKPMGIIELRLQRILCAKASPVIEVAFKN